MPENFSTFADFFETAVGFAPYGYQEVLANMPVASRAIHVPTGTGKTAAAVLAWLWNLRQHPSETPRRLVYCLPMRVLVEQTAAAVHGWVAQVAPDVGVHILMGGESAADWAINLDQAMILIGTQDMLLSRALNRGYGMSRYRWPMQFGLLNNDCLWVMDEVQLMGNGLGTTTQLEAFRHTFGTLRDCVSWWMSATFHRSWLETVDFRVLAQNLEILGIGDESKDQKLLNICRAVKPIEKLAKLDSKTVLGLHRAGALSVVVVNTVEKARSLHSSLETEGKRSGKKIRQAGQAEILLIHSRFRPPDRAEAVRKLNLADRMLRRKGNPTVQDPEREPDEDWITKVRDGGLIVISTQVVEAGVDISAETLITEISPWANMVQRFGRVNRSGEQDSARVFWVDLPKKESAPYEEHDLEAARVIVSGLVDVGYKSIQEVALPSRRPPSHVLRQHDLYGLFSTEKDLASGYTDISVYVRDADRDSDVYIFWRNFKGVPDSDEPDPIHSELCAVPIGQFAKFLGTSGICWEWNDEADTWNRWRGREVRPGMTLLLAASSGGYSDASGWTHDSAHKPSVIEDFERARQKDAMKRDPFSQTNWGFLKNHLEDASNEALRLTGEIGIDDEAVKNAIVLAARWHDVGKAHPKWQAAVLRAATPSTPGQWAKFPYVPGRQFRPDLRHEAASALCAWDKWMNEESGWSALAVYLIACHHGKVRTVLRSIKKKGVDVFGVSPGDKLDPLEGSFSDEVPLDLACRNFGARGEWDCEGFVTSAPSWVGMMIELLGPEIPGDPVCVDAIPVTEPRELGPFRLAYLESLIIAIDWRSSGVNT